MYDTSFILIFHANMVGFQEDLIKEFHSCVDGIYISFQEGYKGFKGKGLKEFHSFVDGIYIHFQEGLIKKFSEK